MNIERLRKALTKTNIRSMALTALAAATDLDDEQKTEVVRRVGAAYLATDEENPEPDAENLRNYLNVLIAGQRAQDYYDQHGHPEGA